MATSIKTSLVCDGTVQTPSYIQPQAAGTANFSIDAASTGQTLAATNGTTITPLGNANNFQGLLLVSETAKYGHSGVFLIGGGESVLIGQTSGNIFSNTAGANNKISVYLNANVLTVQNQTGFALQIRTISLRTFNQAAIS